MADIGLFFGSSTGNGEIIARNIAECFRPHKVDIFDILHTNAAKVKEYNYLIFGVSTWHNYVFQDDWEAFLPGLQSLNLKKHMIALYGLGDQRVYSDSFVDGMGHLYNHLVDQGANIVGFWPVNGYNFRKSLALRNGNFVGLALDEDMQYHLSSQRIKQWVNILVQDFGL